MGRVHFKILRMGFNIHWRGFLKALLLLCGYFGTSSTGISCKEALELEIGDIWD